MSEIRCPRCGGANVVGLEAHPIKLVRYCKDCHDYIANWQQSAIASRDATIKELQEENAVLMRKVEAASAALEEGKE